MKGLYNYVVDINEAQKGRPRKDANVKPGKDAAHNGTGGRWAVDEPTDDDAVEPLKKEELNRNMKRLLMKFKAKEPFFIQGEAGWGKTSIITSMAKRFGRSVITVYLDKCEATDLGGIPVPREGSHNTVYTDYAMPAWASYMFERPEKQFLLFFDEMNQADSAVMNALMPIVLKNEVCGIPFKNFFVGAAGNFSHENETGINELSGPLKSRFKPIIVWDSGGEEEWKQAFKHMHKEWDDIVGAKFIDDIYNHRNLFQNPREVEHKVIQWASEIRKDDERDLFDVEDYLDRLTAVAKPDLTNIEQEQLAKTAELLFNFINEHDTEVNRRSRSKDLIDDNTKENIKRVVLRGYMDSDDPDDDRKYGISRENIASVFCTDSFVNNNKDLKETERFTPLNKEMLDRFINKLESDGITFKYNTDAQWKAAGFSDPTEA